ncbi:hypothetical protein ABZ078_43810 [Streptomyces sp. NPDC006385]|uniref:hypothetical protein n=1 Tax=Streptomyces sp. NPDC006385 TaxID=3156761 RepID=UPI0033A3A6C7
MSRTPDHLATAQDTEAHCRAFEAVKGRGKTLDATARQQLVEAAGGEQEVAAYCAAQTAGRTQDKPEKSRRPRRLPSPPGRQVR